MHSLRLTVAVLEVVLNYAFPSNVRELENLVAQLCVFDPESGEVELADLPHCLRQPDDDNQALAGCTLEEIQA